VTPAAHPAYNLAPMMELLAVGLLLAALPLAWVFWRTRRAAARGGPTGPAVRANRRLALLTTLTLFLTFDLVLFGAFTRLTDSGLGCPDWPGCYGQASPVGAAAHIQRAQEVLPSGPVTHGKAWVEMVHRYLASGVGALILGLCLLTWQRWRSGGGGAVHPLWPTLTLVWVCLQGAFGALTVTMKLFPAIVTLHLLGGMVLIALLAVQATEYRLADGELQPAVLPAALRRGLVACAVLLALQIALGGWVSTNYAVLACQDFPLCQGQLVPDMELASAFTLWRPLGQMPDGTPIAFGALTAIHWVHRLMALLVLAALAALALALRRQGGLASSARWIGALAALQLLSGLSNVVLGWPLLAALVHTGGAAALTLVLASTWRRAAASAPAPVSSGAAAVAEVAAVSEPGRSQARIPQRRARRVVQ